MWMSIVVVLVTLFVILLPLLPSRHGGRRPGDIPSIQIVVLGDIGRSPRMQYHVLSILNHGGSVQIIGYLESQLLEQLERHPSLTTIAIPTSKSLQTSNKLLFLVFGPIKVLLQIWYLWQTLGYRTRPSKWMLVQNPPSIPTLLVCGIICWLRGTRLVIDWHNFGYSILALKLGERHALVRISYVYEFICAKLASAHLTVTDAMAKVLKERLGAAKPILTLHDRPMNLFHPLSHHDRLTFLQRYSLLAEHFTPLSDGQIKLLVSSTSWTADEDFSIFLDALCMYSAKASQHPRLPELVVVITGKGPQKAHYLSKIKELRKRDALDQVSIYTDWLSFDDYASLLGSADLGISLHTSSSGVDLPMKVVDMFGAGLPVLGWNKFAAWPELVTEDVNGKGFGSSQEMADIMSELFEPRNSLLARLQEGALRESKRRWDDEWDPVAGKLFELRV